MLPVRGIEAALTGAGESRQRRELGAARQWRMGERVGLGFEGNGAGAGS